MATAQRYFDISKISFELKDYCDAEEQARRALDIAAAVGASQESLADIRHCLAVILEKQARVDDAEMNYRAALERYKRHDIGGENARLALRNFKVHLLNQGRSDEALIVQDQYGQFV